MINTRITRVSIISGAILGSITIGGFPALFIAANIAANIADINAFIEFLSLMTRLLLLGAISGLLMGLANGILMSFIVFDRPRTRSFSRRLMCIFANILVDSVIGLIPLYYSPSILLADPNNGVVDGMALVLALLFFSLPPTVVTIFLMAVIVPWVMFNRRYYYS